MEHLNVLSIILSTLTPLLVGAVYYSNFLFGKTWKTSLGHSLETQKGSSRLLLMGLSLLMSFLLSFFMIGFCNDIGQEGQFDTFQHGAWHGAFLSVFVVSPVIVLKGLLEQRSWKNILIHVGYWSMTLALMGGIMDSLNHFPNA